MRSKFYPEHVEDPGQIRASLDVVSPAGTVEGWALYTNSLAVCHVRVCLTEVVLGEDLADKFRPDLFQAGLRHGHCAFYVTIPDIGPGVHPLRLIDGRTGQKIDHIGRNMIEVPKFDQRLRYVNERYRWNDKHILSQPTFLRLDHHFECLGAERYIDHVFRFALGRWADSQALEAYGAALLAGTATPTEVFRSVMSSMERRSQSRHLPSIFERDFLFSLSVELPEERCGVVT